MVLMALPRPNTLSRLNPETTNMSMTAIITQPLSVFAHDIVMFTPRGDVGRAAHRASDAWEGNGKSDCNAIRAYPRSNGGVIGSFSYFMIQSPSRLVTKRDKYT